jgi:uncharacterized membrane protein
MSRKDKILHRTQVILSAAGIVVSGYLTYVHLANKIVYCGEYSGCETVQASPYSTFYGIPIALGGVLLYLLLLALSVVELRLPGDTALWVRYAFFGFSLVGLLYSIYLTYLELFVICSVCLWCLTSALILLNTTVVSVWRLHGQAI